MARRTKRPPITRIVTLAPVRRTCSSCGGTLWSVYETQRTVTTLDDVCRLTLTVVRCHNPACSHYHRPYRPEEEGAWTLPHHEFGLDVIALVGTLRYRHHRSIPEIHQALREQHVAIAPRTVAHLLARYEKLVTALLASPVVAGYCYTQLTDTAQERNGLLDAQRRPKADLARIAAINGLPSAAVPGDAIAEIQIVHTANRIAAGEDVGNTYEPGM